MKKNIILDNIKKNFINNAINNGLSVKIINDKQVELTQQLDETNKSIYLSQENFEEYCTQLLFKK
jgi:hypothetical protein